MHTFVAIAHLIKWTIRCLEICGCVSLAPMPESSLALGIMELGPVIQSDKSRHQKLTESRGNWNDFLSRLRKIEDSKSEYIDDVHDSFTTCGRIA